MMHLVNGYPCRSCADEELAKKGIDPAHPKKELSGSEVYGPPEADRAPARELAVNRPEKSGHLGQNLEIYA